VRYLCLSTVNDFLTAAFIGAFEQTKKFAPRVRGAV